MRVWSGLVASVAAGGFLTAPTAWAQEPRWALGGGHYLSEGPSVGAEYAVRLGPRLSLNPNVEQRFSHYANFTSLSADLHFDFPTGESTLLWLGAGLGAAVQEPKVEGIDTEVQLATNFLWAVGFRSGSVMPYIQARVVRTDETLFSLGFGLRF